MEFNDPLLEQLWNQLPLRFRSKIEFVGECWKWTAVKKYRNLKEKAEHPDRGYGLYSVGNKSYLTHRLTYLALHHSLPDLPLDHFRYPELGCIGPNCCNPRHLVATSHRDNILRSSSRSAINVLKTHCPVGHEYTEENTYIKKKKNGNVTRECRTCKNQHQRDGLARKSAQLLEEGLTTMGTVRKLPRNPNDKRAAGQPTRLKAEDIPVIRSLAANKTPRSKIAAKYGVNVGTIHALLAGKTWKDI